MPRVAVTVIDSGIGISEADMSRVGTRLFRGANAIESATPGTGLGLSIAKKILGSCGGDLSVRSRFGEGGVRD